MSDGPSPELATLGGGCFWCTEAVFADLTGVLEVIPGYAGGHTRNPTYEEVCEGSTGHAEVVQVHFDPAAIGYREILEVFFATHDPTTLNRQGHDVGSQYRSIILTDDDRQRAVAREVLDELGRSGAVRRKVVTEVVPLAAFYPAEEYHRNYFRRHPEAAYCQAVIAPKVEKFRHTFATRLRAP